MATSLRSESPSLHKCIPHKLVVPSRLVWVADEGEDKNPGVQPRSAQSPSIHKMQRKGFAQDLATPPFR